MRLLLDTHVLIWWLEGNDRLGTSARTLIADSGNQIIISLATPWEIAIKHRLGKLPHSGAQVMKAALAQGIEQVSLAPAHLVALEAMPLHHRDPFDRLIVAQAAIERAVIITNDSAIADYGIRCLPA